MNKICVFAKRTYIEVPFWIFQGLVSSFSGLGEVSGICGKIEKEGKFSRTFGKLTMKSTDTMFKARECIQKFGFPGGNVSLVLKSDFPITTLPCFLLSFFVTLWFVFKVKNTSSTLKLLAEFL